MVILARVRMICFLGIIVLAGIGSDRLDARAGFCDYDCADSCSEEGGTFNGLCVIPAWEDCSEWPGCSDNGEHECDGNGSENWPGCENVCDCEDVCEG